MSKYELGLYIRMATKKSSSNLLTAGDKAADFKVKDQNGETKSLKDFAGSYLLLYFYPKDMTPGCTTEACGFRDKYKELQKLGIAVVGVSCDSIENHQKFAKKYNLNFPLLADTEKKMVENYGVWTEKSMYGKKFMGIQRDSFLIDPKGKIVKHYVKVKPAVHVDEVIADLKAIKQKLK